MTERRIAPSKRHENLLDRLTSDQSNSGTQVFDTKQKALMFAAALAVAKGRARIPVKRRGQGIRFDVFQRDLDDVFIRALALKETEDLRVLADERCEERVRIFEEYAQAGLDEIQKVCFEQDGDPVDNLIALTNAAQQSESADVPGVDQGVLRGILGVG